METCIVRVWLPDRPGALGEVATRIGDAGGEIVGIDILERSAGRAIDELAVQIPDVSAIPALVGRIRSVPGVDIEDLRVLDGTAHDPRADVLETAAVIVGARDRSTLLESVVTHGRRVLGGEWAAVLRIGEGEVLAGDGDLPLARWLVAFVEGSRTSARVSSGESGPDDVVWAPLPGTGLALVVGRAGAPFRARERRQVSALARIVDTRLLDLSRRLHPSNQG
ncbi:MAG TPA: ACT domain-containing protein [Acidimicrobiales bacterium]|nr:ACT domain-containing protein [Acidimicrobiales bacterium]